MIKLYTTHCPQCEALTIKMNKANIPYSICDDMDEITQRGFTSMPMLEVNGEYMTFIEAIRWVNNYDN